MRGKIGRIWLFLALILSLSLVFFGSCPTPNNNNNNNNNKPVPPPPPPPPPPGLDNSDPLNPGQQMPNKWAIEYFKDENILAGWNLGNQFDAPQETSWISTAVNQAQMNGLKAAGFDLVRIPITWTSKRDSNKLPTETILTRLDEVLGYAETAGLKVMINTHHDDSWFSMSSALQNQTNRDTITNEFSALWTAIANKFKNKGYWLMFEGLNEPKYGEQWTLPANQQTAKTYTDLVAEWNQAFVSAVRATGGNNSYRYLVIKGYVARWSSTPDIINNMPQDVVPGRQVVSFHYYQPESVGLGNETDIGPPSTYNWGSSAQKNKVDADLRSYNEVFISKNYPVLIGECGATRQVYTQSYTGHPPSGTLFTAAELTASAHESRQLYLEHLYKTGKKYSLVPVYWDNGTFGGSGTTIYRETFGLFDRSTGLPYNVANTWEFAECIEAMIKAVKPTHVFPWRN